MSRCSLPVLVLLMSNMLAPVASGSMAGLEWPGSPEFVWSLGNAVMGYEFEALSPVTIIALGAYDHLGDGFENGDKDVGIYDASENLLASTTVSTSDPLEGHFRYGDLGSSLTLIAGQTYVVAASGFGGVGGGTRPVSGLDGWAWREAGDMGFIEAPGINYIESRFDFVPALVYPTGTNTRDGFFGGNIKLGEATVIPEPSTLAIWSVLGLVGASVYRRKRRAA